jgi:hypothetical protein
MTSGLLVDLDPPPARDRRWPFYLAWAVGGLVVSAVLVTHLPAPPARAPAPVAPPVAAPAETPAPNPTGTPAPLRQVAPLPAAPARR